MSEKRKVIVLISGGIDSVTALYDAHRKYDVICGLSYNYGSKHNVREIPMAAFHCTQLGIHHEMMTLDFMRISFTSNLLESGGEIPDGHYEEETMKQTVVPFRNGIMLSIATGYAESVGAEGLVIAAHAGDHAIYPDCREPFMKAMAKAMAAGTYAKIELLRPFIDINKAEIVKLGSEMNIRYDRTYSCYKGGKVHCGTCGTCVERREAFINAGVCDPTEYLSTGPLPPKPE